MAIATRIKTSLTASSWIRRMFEEAAQLKAKNGPDAVGDFTVGHSDLEPSERFKENLKRMAADPTPGQHRYPPNSGFEEVRDEVAAHLAVKHKLRGEIDRKHIAMTVGAAGALNVALNAILDPRDEVIILAPYFVEYKFYISNMCQDASIKVVQTTGDFQLNMEAINSALSPRTKAIIVNSPNNPTGATYLANPMRELQDVVSRAEGKYNSVIYMVFDQPYDKLVYDGVVAPAVLDIFPNGLLAYSYSKALAIPGERMGFLAVNPRHQDVDDLIQALPFCNRTVGGVNATALMQRAVAGFQDEAVGVERYQGRRDVFYSGLQNSGYDMGPRPTGAYYLFPKSPINDDVKFVAALKKNNVLAVPGVGFGRPGHFRLAYSATPKTVIERFLPAFEAAREEVLQG